MLFFCKELCDNDNREVNTMKQTLWTREFTRITAATALGAAGGIISQFALSFLVFDETGSTLAAALVVAIQLIPMVLLPLVVAPMMDRLPRKPFLVWGDLLNGVCYAGAGLFLLHSSFSYIAYLAFSLLVSCLGAFDELAYNSFYPLLLPKGQEERAYTVSAMLYPILKVLMMPLAAVLYDKLGVGRLLLIQAALSVLAAFLESRIRVQESRRDQEPLLSLKTWWRDVREAAAYLRQEHGLHGLYAYMSVTNGMASGYSPLLIAFFRTAPGFTTAMYSFFSVAEFAGRTIGGMELVEKITKENWFDFDVVVASPDMMGVVGRLGKVLGPKGLMPSPKAGTVTPDVAKAVQEVKAGKIEYRLDKTNIIHCPIGKVSFGPEKLAENFNALMGAIIKAKPAASKGQYIKSCVAASTMGPGVKMNTAKI